LVSDARTHTRNAWLAALAKHAETEALPDSLHSSRTRHYDFASRDEIRAIQDEKLAALTPFLYENSQFYRRRFDRLGLLPIDIQSVEDLSRWPVVTKEEMSLDADQHPPYGSYLTIGLAEWQDRGWMQFSTSGSTGRPRVFRYTHADRQLWVWANARALHAMGIGRGDAVFLIGGFGPHVWLWGVYETLIQMRLAVIPGGGLDGTARARIVERLQPSVIACTPSYALYLGRVLQDLGLDPAASSVRKLFLGGEPALGIEATRTRIESLWNARIVEFYGCTEASPHVGGFSCPYSARAGQAPFTHLLEDVQIWETVDGQDYRAVAPGQRGLTVCTSLNSESSPQLRFLVGDYTTFDRSTCECGRSHVRALGSFVGRADDVINLRGVKFFPSQIEEAIRSVSGTGDEFEIILDTNDDGLDIMTIRVEHPEHATPADWHDRIAGAVRSRCEVRADVEILAPKTLPKTEFKARRVNDRRVGRRA
jgi:phenylacetate-CoA ligase